MPSPSVHEIRSIAKKYGYFERTEVKSKTLFFERWKSRSEDRAYPDLINVFYTTRGVMTKIKHPKGGYNQLWRSDAYDSLESLSAIFENPRIHTGRGYRRAENALRGCAECGLQKERSEYSSNQWRKGSGSSKCRICVEQKQSSIKASDNARMANSAIENKPDQKSPTLALFETIRKIDPDACEPLDGWWRDFDVAGFREILATALAEHRHHRYDGGYSWLVDTPENYSRRIGRFVAPHEMPKPPNFPILTQINQSNEETIKYLINELAEYKAYCDWNQAALEALEQRFPDCLELFLHCPGMKPRLNNPQIPLYTIREAIDYTEQVAEFQFSKFEETIFTLREKVVYSPSKNGPELFFQEMEECKQVLDEEFDYDAPACEMTYWRLTLCCMLAFRRSDLPESKVIDIEDAWFMEIEDARFMETHSPDAPELWKKFTDFATPKIKELEALNFSDLCNESFAEATRTRSQSSQRNPAQRRCAECCLRKERSEYSSNQWRKGSNSSKCKLCIAETAQAGPHSQDSARTNSPVIHGPEYFRTGLAFIIPNPKSFTYTLTDSELAIPYVDAYLDKSCECDKCRGR